MRQIKVHKSTGPVKLYANVPSRTRHGKTYLVTYIRKPGVTERWSCTCEDHIFNKRAKRRHCVHIMQVRHCGEMLNNGRPVLITF